MIKLFGLIGLVVVLISGNPLKYEIGDAVADFRLKNVDGKMVALSDYASCERRDRYF